MTDPLSALIDQEWDMSLPAPATALVAALVAHGGDSVAAVLFYGSNLRSGDMEGVLDFYVLVDSLTGWRDSRPLALATRLLPPTVEYWEVPWQGHTLRAKVAVMGIDQFTQATRFDGMDTTIWARFTQPVMLAHARDQAARAQVRAAVVQAVTTATSWAALLGPAEGTPRDYWEALFKATYSAELRVEKASRGVSIVDHAADRYAALLPPAWAAARVPFEEQPDGRLRPLLTPAERERGASAWAWRGRFGKGLNIARLVKAAFTFTGGVDYLLWKLHRHSGVRLELTPWQRRHPILSAPGILWKLKRMGAIR
ncbi:hypothetical protein [Niveispirillum sp.]|uniref:hypothetical protein n=1 Tax=Niveispirillum sp. TaxID=1917217 RepID=UPI001B4C3D03|nr:hypothetical protein [Niveispirillum sp.]MBP7335800.1 hypothetical protein [Niveispirillum sp.]